MAREYGISDSGGLELLETYCRAADRCAGATREIERDGMVTKDRFGQLRPHPLLSVERDSRSQMVQSLKALNLDLEPIRDRIGRPGGR